MMKSVAVLLAIVSVAVAVEIIPILSRTDVRGEDGTFAHSYVSGDGTIFKETGKVIPTLDGKGLRLIKEGLVEYKSPEGIPIKLTYIADDKGFRPTGTHLPVAPKLPLV